MVEMIGRFALATAGRDKNRVFIIVGSEGEQFLYIADGKHRRVEKPKLKKAKHLRILQEEAPEFARLAKDGTLTNQQAAAAVSCCNTLREE